MSISVVVDLLDSSQQYSKVSTIYLYVMYLILLLVIVDLQDSIWRLTSSSTEGVVDSVSIETCVDLSYAPVYTYLYTFKETSFLFKLSLK